MTSPSAPALRNESHPEPVHLPGVGPVVLPDDEAALVGSRLDSWRPTFAPASPVDEWFFGQAVVNSVRADRCRAHEAALRVYQAGRAESCWDEDRRLAAEEVGAGLSKRPALVVGRLRRTSQGCDWLIDHWRRLAQAWVANGEWTEAQTDLALDLLGTPPEFRDGLPDDPPAALARREIARLEALKAGGLDGLDDHERTLATLGLETEASPALAHLRRFETACLRRVQRARARLRDGEGRAGTAAAPSPAPSPAPAPAPAPRPGRPPPPRPCRK